MKRAWGCSLKSIRLTASAVGSCDPQSNMLFGKKRRFMTGCATIAATLQKLYCNGSINIYD
jgi:hypothetical protein